MWISLFSLSLSVSLSLSLMIILLSEKIYYCTLKDDIEPNRFMKFCKTFLPEYAVEQTPHGNDKESVVLVLSIPTKTRFNPYEYFSERVKNTVETCGLNKAGKNNTTRDQLTVNAV